MNSIQLAQRLARNLNVEDPFNLPADAGLDVLSAINGGLASFYRELPGIYKRTTLSHTLRGPRAVTITYAAKYSHTVGDNTFDASMMGCSVRFDSAASDTQVTGPNTVLDDYLGDNLGPLTANVYSDVTPIQDVIQRVIGHIRVYDTTQAQPTLMMRDERLRSGRPLWWNWPQWNEGWFPPDGCLFGSIGRPRYYYLDPVGQSQGGEPEFLLRSAPWPDQDYTIRMEAELSTQRITMTDLSTARPIFVPDTYVDDIFIPLCEAELIGSPFWRDQNAVKNVLLRRDNVLATKMPKIPYDLAPTGNLVGTPRGF
jgi:hypothetical protein